MDRTRLAPLCSSFAAIQPPPRRTHSAGGSGTARVPVGEVDRPRRRSETKRSRAVARHADQRVRLRNAISWGSLTALQQRLEAPSCSTGRGSLRSPVASLLPVLASPGPDRAVGPFQFRKSKLFRPSRNRRFRSVPPGGDPIRFRDRWIVERHHSPGIPHATPAGSPAQRSPDRSSGGLEGADRSRGVTM